MRTPLGEDSLQTKRGDGAEDPQKGCSSPGRRATWICCTMLRSWTRNSFASLALSDSPLRAWESWLCRGKKEQGYFHVLTSSSCRRSRRVRIGAGHGARSLCPGACSLQQPHRGVLLPLLPWGWEKGGLAISSGLPKPWIWDAQTRCASLATLFQEPGKSPVINYLSETSRLLGGCKQHAGFRVEMAPRLQNLTLRGHAVLLGMYEGQGEEVGGCLAVRESREQKTTLRRCLPRRC